MPRIYLDHNATSPLRPEARGAMARALDQACGNPSSLHAFGRTARLVLETAREEVARLIGALPDEIVLTSGGTESNNLAIYGAAGRPAAATGRVVTSAVEHPSVLGPMQDLERSGLEVSRIRPTRDGVVEAEAVLESAGGDAAFVSLMLANNEVGTLQPVAEVGRELRRRGILLHCDAAQAAGKVPIDGVSGEALVIALDLEGIAVSAGSACSAGTIRRSHVLEAMGLVDESGASIRLSLGPSTTREETQEFVETLERVVDRARTT